MKDRKVFVALFRPYLPALIGGALCVTLSAAIGLMAPAVVGGAVDGLRHGVDRAGLLRAAWTILAIAAGSGIFLYGARILLIGMSRHIEYDIRNDLFSHFTRLPLEYYQAHRTGDLMARAVNDLSAVRMLLGPGIMQSLNTAVTGSLAIALMLRVHAGLTGIALLSLPFVAVSTKVVGQKVHVLFEKIQEYFAEISAHAQENFSAVRLLRGYAREATELEKFQRENAEYVRRNRSLIGVQALFFPLLQTLVGMGFVAVLWYGGRLVMNGRLTVGGFVQFNLYLVELIWPMIALGWVVNLFQRGTASWNRLREIRDTPPSIRDAPGILVHPRIDGEIEFRHLTYSAAGGRLILREIDWKVSAGTTVGIVGRTGAGKSTLVELIPRLLDPPQGTLFIDGREIHRYALADLRHAIGMVPQESFLFSETLAANVAYGRPDAEREAIEEAAGIAGLGADVAEFPAGLDTVVGERGIALSGGQKQRAAIARAILRDPPILILDDALSAVDSETELLIRDRLSDVARRRTTLIVAHRLSSVEHADSIVMMEQGRIVERGRHEDLLALGGAYAALWETQQIEEELETA
jgi:ATP-binding cassette, subfamily B, multidrug efflux pump